MVSQNPQPDRPAIEADPRLPSGEWIGFFQQPGVPGAPGGRGWMDLILTFAEGLIRGEGRDLVGEFAILGRYDLAAERVTFHKRYLGQHDVYYEGFVEAGRGIWGKWTIARESAKGGFHIWPKGMEDPTGSKLHAEAEAPAEEEAVVVVEPASDRA